MNLISQFKEYNFSKNLIDDNDTIIVGFSGGPDSVFLVEMLKQIKKEKNINIVLVHINHMYRGKDADDDEEFSKNYAKENNFQFFSKKINLEELAKKTKKSFEETGREERYKFFDEVLNKVSANKIATAHNKDDQVETFLFRLIRGTSLDGLECIKEKKDNIIRPILNFYKKDIVKYLDENKIKYRTDKTNFENTYTRNSIRLDLIPFIETRYNPKFKDKILNIIDEIKNNNVENDIKLSEFVVNNEILISKIKEKSVFLQKKILTKYLNTNNIYVNSRKLQQIISLIEKNGTKFTTLNSDFLLIKDYDKIYISENKKNIIKDVCIKIPFNVKFGRYTIIADYNLDTKNNCYFKTNFNYGDVIKIRNRQDGDKIKNNKNGINYKLKKIFIDKKIPKIVRDEIPIFLYNESIFWVPNVVNGYLENNTEEGIIIVVKEDNI